jgi:hypothetical protein
VNPRPAPFPFTSMFQNGAEWSRVRSGKSFQKRKRFSSAAPKPRALDHSAPFRRLALEKGKGATVKATPRAWGFLPPPVGRPPAHGTEARKKCLTQTGPLMEAATVRERL